MKTVISIIFLIIISGAGYFIFQNKPDTIPETQSNLETNSINNERNSDKISNTEQHKNQEQFDSDNSSYTVYTDSNNYFSFDYPNGWGVTSAIAQDNLIGGVTVELTEQESSMNISGQLLYSFTYDIESALTEAATSYTSRDGVSIDRSEIVTYNNREFATMVVTNSEHGYKQLLALTIAKNTPRDGISPAVFSFIYQSPIETYSNEIAERLLTSFDEDFIELYLAEQNKSLTVFPELTSERVEDKQGELDDTLLRIVLITKYNNIMHEVRQSYSEEESFDTVCSTVDQKMVQLFNKSLVTDFAKEDIGEIVSVDGLKCRSNISAYVVELILPNALKPELNQATIPYCFSNSSSASPGTMSSNESDYTCVDNF